MKLFSLLYLFTLMLLFRSLHYVVSSFPSSSSHQYHPCAHADALLLLQFKEHLHFHESVLFKCTEYITEYCCTEIKEKTLSWNNGTRMDCCQWEGVTCDTSTGHVIGLDLSCSGLRGPIYPNSTLFQLRRLQKLNLAQNAFMGSTIPNEIGSLASLTHLDLSGSWLSGSIPQEISHLSELVSLDLSFNFWLNASNLLFLHNLTKLEILSFGDTGIHSCSIPRNLSASLRYLDLSHNDLSGPIPDSIFQLPKLQSLFLNENPTLVGSLPKFSWSCNHTLKMLDLSHTGISGELTNSIGNLKFLEFFSLGGSSKFSGSIPESIGNLTQLEVIGFGFNGFNGEIPDAAFSNLQKLTQLYLFGNNFVGLFPSSIANLTQLEILFLSYNNFTGSLPRVASRLQKLQYLLLMGNRFNGSVPPWIFSIPCLTHLDLSNNRFTGQLPEITSSRSSLKLVSLSSNQLDGPIPPSIFKLVNLTYLDLSFNPWTWGDSSSAQVTASNLSILELSLSSCEIREFPSFLRNLTSLNYLDLSNNKLDGQIPNWFTSMHLSKIEFLNLSSCEIREFPSFLRNLTSLETLDLSNNKLDGQIPNWFTSMHLSEIEFLDLSQNNLTGSISQLLFPILFYLDLHNNQLQGPFPNTICNSRGLRFLNLKKNKFDGMVPQCLGELENLFGLDLGMNNFSGIAPTMFVKSTQLTTIDLNGNQLQGRIPRSLVNCTQLEVLDLGNNKLNDTFPDWLRDLVELKVLILRSNTLYGPLTSSRSKIWFPKLRIFDLSCNEFTGALPKDFFNDFKGMINVSESQKEAKYLEYDRYHVSINLVIKGLDVRLEKVLTISTTIDISRNQIEGEIPMLIGNLNSLRLLNLSHNHFNGSIPHQIGNFTFLESLDISWNQLTGKIPEQITSLTFLEVLNLSQNHLEGQIPKGKQLNTFENDSYGGNLNLCGFPLSRECYKRSHVPQQKHVDEEEDESDFLSGLTWKVIAIGFGCGVIFGIFLENLMSRIGKPEWLVNLYGGKRRRMVLRTRRNGGRH